MENLSLLVWLTQLGLSVALPLAGFVLLGVWLHNRFGLGVWVIVAGAVLGVLCAVNGLKTNLRAMEKMTRDKKEDAPPVSFNEHV